MSPLRQQMIDAMVLRGLARRTQQAYLSVVAQLAAHYHCSPDRLDAAQVKAWLLHRITERHLAYTTVNQAVCALKFFFDIVLGRTAEAIAIPYARTPQRQPEILSREELARLFEPAANLRTRTLLMTAYAAGLRVSEVCALRVADIDSAPDRMCIRVVAGKGGKDRYTLLSPSLLEALRVYWRICKPRDWLFPRATDVYVATAIARSARRGPRRPGARRACAREVLPVPYAHWVFTLPHALNLLAMRHPRWLYGALFDSAAATLLELAANPRWLGAMPGFSLVLHTWRQDLRVHLHVHALITCGGLDAEGGWRAPVRGTHFLFPVRAASQVFRGKFLARLDAAQRSGELPDDPQGAPDAWHARRRALLAHDWVVYAKPPPGGPTQVLDYLARYTHRVALSNDRLLGCDAGQVRLRVRDNETGGKRTVSMSTDAFIGRFLRHVLPAGFKRVRHYGLLACGHKRARLAAARAALQTPAPQPVAIEAAEDFLARVSGEDPRCCRHCGVGRWHTVEIVMARRYDPPAPVPRCRDGPP